MLSSFNRDPNQPRLECWISNFTLCSPTNTFPNGILIHLNWILHFCADQKCYTFALHTEYILQSCDIPRNWISHPHISAPTQRCIHELSSLFPHSCWFKIIQLSPKKLVFVFPAFNKLKLPAFENCL